MRAGRTVGITLMVDWDQVKDEGSFEKVRAASSSSS